MGEAGRGCGADAVGVFDEPGVGHLQQHDVLGREVGSEDTGGVGAFDESDEAVEGLDRSRSMSGAADTSIVTRSAIPRSRACMAVTAWM